MFRKPWFVVLFSSVYLVVYLLFFIMENFEVVFKMFLAAPLILVWLAYTILRYGKFKGRELSESEEWGYSDK